MKRKNLKNKKGQALLLIVMLLATVITVVMTVVFKSSTDTQITKLEQESQQGLAAAEAGIERALSQRALGGEITFDEQGFRTSARVSIARTSPEFVSPLIQKDQQYTFYLSTYDENNNSFSDYYNNSFIIAYGSEQGQNCDNLALEISIVYGANNNIARYIADTGERFISENLDLGTDVDVDFTNPTQHFTCSTSIINTPGPDQTKMVLIRFLSFSGTPLSRIGVRGSGGVNLPAQGREVISTATSLTTTQGGVAKRVRLFQSYPQIPADFFVTQWRE